MRDDRNVRLNFTPLARVIDLREVFVWGSAAKTRYRASRDVDLIVVSPSFGSLVQPARKAIVRKYLKSSHPIDVVCLTPEEMSLLKLLGARESGLSRRRRIEWK